MKLTYLWLHRCKGSDCRDVRIMDWHLSIYTLHWDCICHSIVNSGFLNGLLFTVLFLRFCSLCIHIAKGSQEYNPINYHMGTLFIHVCHESMELSCKNALSLKLQALSFDYLMFILHTLCMLLFYHILGPAYKQLHGTVLFFISKGSLSLERICWSSILVLMISRLFYLAVSVT